MKISKWNTRDYDKANMEHFNRVGKTKLVMKQNEVQILGLFQLTDALLYNLKVGQLKLILYK